MKTLPSLLLTLLLTFWFPQRACFGAEGDVNTHKPRLRPRPLPGIQSAPVSNEERLVAEPVRSAAYDGPSGVSPDKARIGVIHRGVDKPGVVKVSPGVPKAVAGDLPIVDASSGTAIRSTQVRVIPKNEPVGPASNPTSR